MKKILFFLFTCALTIESVQAQEAADSIKIYYRRGYRNVDPSFRDNRSQLEYFLNSIDRDIKKRPCRKDRHPFICLSRRNSAGQRTIGGPTGGRAESLSCPRRKRTSPSDRTSRRRYRMEHATGTSRSIRHDRTQRSIGHSRPYSAMDLR